MNLSEYKIYANKLLELLPEAKAVAMDENKELNQFMEKPFQDGRTWDSGGMYSYIGKIDYSGDWRDTLVVKKWTPSYGDKYYLVSLDTPKFVDYSIWTEHDCDIHRLKHNLVFKTREEAVTRAKELLSIKE